MDEDDERSADGLGLGRTLALSDGIFAIAMTLLAFQIQAPDLHGNDVHHLARALGNLGDRYGVFALSFSVIGLVWLGHHRLFSQVKRADEPVMRINLVLLMTIAILPFPSAVLGRYGSQRAAVILYASNMVVVGTLLTALGAVARHRRLLASMTSPIEFRKSLWRSVTMVVVFGLSIPVAIVAPSVAPYTWITLVPLRLAAPAIGARARRSGSSQPSP